MVFSMFPETINLSDGTTKLVKDLNDYFQIHTIDEFHTKWFWTRPKEGNNKFSDN